MPDAFAVGVYVRMPAALTAGWIEKSPLLLLPTTKSTDWLDSFAGPALMFVAQFGTDCAPASSATTWSPPFVNDGASLTGLTVTLTVAVSKPPFPSLIV